MKVADLHLHTRFSDGTDSPPQLLERAARFGFAAIAVTDHDTLDAVPETLAAGHQLGLEIIPGVEITCCVHTTEIHMLGYFPANTWRDDTLRRVLEHSKQVRQQRIVQIVERLHQLGIAITVGDVLACSDCGTTGRPHVAIALQQRGVVRSTDEAFDRFLRRGRPAWVERYRMTAAEAIGHIHRAGGVAVLAHPALNHVDRHIRQMQSQGLDGIEVWHSRHSPAQTAQYFKLADALGLLATGGSDCHGQLRGPALLGNIRLPYQYVEALKQRAARAAQTAPNPPVTP
jgi:predicted metal-dependent phosphoesterase TrpH